METVRSLPLLFSSPGETVSSLSVLPEGTFVHLVLLPVSPDSLGPDETWGVPSPGAAPHVPRDVLDLSLGRDRTF